MEMMVELGALSYQIYIERGILNKVERHIKEKFSGKKIFIISDDRVYALYGECIESQLNGSYDCGSYIIPHGEQSKNFQMLSGIYSELLKAGITRSDLIIALGGGVVGDLAGFVAATYLRGIPFIQIPTSLLAQVDSSIGGKVAVDLPEGKNLVGAFYQPKMVLIDPNVLETLPKRYLKDGMGEVIKYGCIKDKELFELLEQSGSYENLKEHMTTVIYRCVNIKRDIVEKDQFDKGERMLLNFGHTLAHAIEQYCHYTRESHGEAVAEGMYQITRISEKKGFTKEGTAEAIGRILKMYGLPLKADIPMENLVSAITRDKKNFKNTLNLILLKEISESEIYPADIQYFDEVEMI